MINNYDVPDPSLIGMCTAKIHYLTSYLSLVSPQQCPHRPFDLLVHSHGVLQALLTPANVQRLLSQLPALTTSSAPAASSSAAPHGLSRCHPLPSALPHESAPPAAPSSCVQQQPSGQRNSAQPALQSDAPFRDSRQSVEDHAQHSAGPVQ